MLLIQLRDRLRNMSLKPFIIFAVSVYCQSLYSSFFSLWVYVMVLEVRFREGTRSEWSSLLWRTISLELYLRTPSLYSDIGATSPTMKTLVSLFHGKSGVKRKEQRFGIKKTQVFSCSGQVAAVERFVCTLILSFLICTLEIMNHNIAIACRL